MFCWSGSHCPYFPTWQHPTSQTLKPAYIYKNAPEVNDRDNIRVQNPLIFIMLNQCPESERSLKVRGSELYTERWNIHGCHSVSIDVYKFGIRMIGIELIYEWFKLCVEASNGMVHFIYTQGSFFAMQRICIGSAPYYSYSKHYNFPCSIIVQSLKTWQGGN